MVPKRKIIAMLPLPLLALFLVGCPKRPSTTTAAPPAPSAPAVSVAAAPGAGMMAGAGAVSAPVAPEVPASMRPPRPGEFAATRQLKQIHFDFDKYHIRPGDAKILDENARWMKANSNSLILIEGHCDERGTNEYNLALGERRAKSTLNYLVSRGVQASRMILISYGEERPLCTEKNGECWAQNRRADFLVKLQ